MLGPIVSIYGTPGEVIRQLRWFSPPLVEPSSTLIQAAHVASHLS